MKKKALKKDFFMEIVKSYNRFISIFFIVALGVAFFSGIRAAEPDMRYSADAYFDGKNLTDIRVMGTMGITRDDVELLAGLPDIEKAEPGYYADLLCEQEGSQKVIRVLSDMPTFNQVTLEEGRMPETPEEILIDIDFAKSSGYRLGDTIHLNAPKDQDMEDILAGSAFTVTGFASSPLYVSFERGSTNVGNGEITGFAVVQEKAFTMEVYTYADLRVQGAAALTAFTDDYENRIGPVVDKIETEYADLRCEVRYQEVMEEVDEALLDAEKELLDAEREADEKLSDAEQELSDARQELLDARQELEDGKQKLSDAKKELEDGRRELLDAKKTVEEESKKLEDGKREYEDGVLEYKYGLDDYLEGKEEYEKAAAEMNEAEKLLKEARGALDAGWEEYEKGAAQVADMQKSYDELRGSIARMEAAGLEPPQDMLAALAALEAGIAQGEAKLANSLKHLEASEAELSAKEAEFAKGREELNKAGQQIEEANKKLSEARQELRDAEGQIAEGEAALADARNKIKTGEADMKKGEQEIADGEIEIADGEIEIAEGEIELADGYKEYEEKKQEAEEKIADAKKELSDAREDAADIEVPKWYVEDRDFINSYTECGENADRIRAIGEVFPVIFFLVAALISLTTMTRMVEEQRTQIGTLKALGYGKLSIAGKYIWYALSATIGGSIFGILIGQKILPYIIITAYQIMYPHMPNVVVPYNIPYALMAATAATVCTAAAAIVSCYKELAAAPSELMRPVPPRQGKRIFLEYIPFVWNRLNFTGKATCRNLIRYKKRFFMTVFGIGGCMALMMVGFGLRDSILDIGLIQYSQLQTYEGQVVMDGDAAEKKKEALYEKVKENEIIQDSIRIQMETVDVSSPEGKKEAWLVVPEDDSRFAGYTVLRDRKSAEVYELDDSGIMLTEKLAKMLDVQPGETVTIMLDDKPYEAVISRIVENYMFHYIYLSPGYYNRLVQEAPEWNTIYFKAEGEPSAIQAAGENILENKAALNVAYLDTIKGQVEDMLDSLDIVIIVLIISAGMLAFVVLYNLNNININERKRELASIKVLGFYDMELASYVYRENILLTLIGAGAGALFGKILHRFIIVTVEIENTMFGRSIYPRSYILSILLTFAFAIFVNLVMYFKLKKIDMVESLKSVE